jgi:hypothetical protein
MVNVYDNQTCILVEHTIKMYSMSQIYRSQWFSYNGKHDMKLLTAKNSILLLLLIPGHLMYVNYYNYRM